MKFNYKEVKESYIEIKQFLEKTSGTKVKNLNSKIAEDLSLWGDDNYEFLIEFVEKYKLDFDNFKYNEHFESEGELFNSAKTLLWIITLPFKIIAWFVKLIFPKLETDLDNSFIPKANDRKDLTFGDLIVCKLKGKFCLRENTLIEI